QVRCNPVEGALEGHSNDPGGLLGGGHTQGQVSTGPLQGRDNMVGGIHQSSIPVEYHGIVALHRECSSSSSTAWQAGGSGASRESSRPFRGCGTTRRWACKNIREKPRRAKASRTASEPYFSSPTMGWPWAARCTRIWCVRPLRSSAPSRL